MGNLKALIGHWGYLAIFALVVLGNVGVPVPENSVFWVAGYLVRKGRLQLPVVLLVGIVAAVAGGDPCRPPLPGVPRPAARSEEGRRGI